MAFNGLEVQAYSTEILARFDDNLVAGGITNQNYRPGPTVGGHKTVIVYKGGEPTIETYSGSAWTPSKPDGDTTKTMTLDQSNVGHFYLDDLDTFYNDLPLFDDQIDRVAYGLASEVDTFVLGLHGDALAANKFAARDVTGEGDDVIDSGSDLITVLRYARMKLNAQSIPMSGRFVVLPPEIEMYLSEDFRTRDTEFGDSVAINGQVGRAEGFNIVMSNNVQTDASGNVFKIMFGHPAATTYAGEMLDGRVQAIPHTRSYEFNQLHIFGAKVYSPEALGRIDVDVPA